MSRTLALAVALALGACTTSAVTLKNPATGQVAQCGPYYVDAIGSDAQARRESRCLDDYQRQGFVRVSD